MQFSRGLRGIARRRPSGIVQRFKKCDKRSRLRWIQAVAVCRHIAAALQHLADELVLREAPRDSVERGPTLAAAMIERVAVVALLFLKDRSALSFERSAAFDKFRGNR